MIPAAAKFICLCAVLLAPAFACAAPVAEIAETKGAVSVIKSSGKRLIVSPQSVVEEGDIVVTEANSTAVLAFTDGSKTALRPLSRFAIAAYRYAEASPKEDKGLFQLLAGGLRTLTGAIGKRGNRDAYGMQGATATIGIRGTEFTARLCRDDCGDSAREAAEKSVPAGRLQSLHGEVFVVDEAGRRRPLTVGMALHVGERIEAGAAAWAGIVFADGTKLVLRAGSIVQIRDYAYQPAEPVRNSFVVGVLKGALRVATGLIAKRTPEKVKFDMVTATIGIRGTDFDAWCVQGGDPTRPAECGEAALATVREGRIALGNAQGELELASGDTGSVAASNAAPERELAPFTFPSDDDSPFPTTLPDFDAATGDGRGGDGDGEGALFVAVHEGRVVLQQNGTEVELGRGESGVASAGREPKRLEATPEFMSRDPFLKSVNFDAVSCTLP